MIMRVDFYKGDEGRLCGWIATPPHRRAFQGTTMAAGRDLPHDLNQFTIERALDVRDGFWGLLAHGASFASVPGRRPTRPGRALVRAHHAALMAVEGIVNGHACYSAWKHGGATSPFDRCWTRCTRAGSPCTKEIASRWSGRYMNSPGHPRGIGTHTPRDAGRPLRLGV